MAVHMRWYHWLFLILILLTQATWIFNDARKRGENPWLWGFFGLLNVPSNLIIYLLVTRWGVSRCPSCRRRQLGTHTHCRACGATLPYICQTCGRILQKGWVVCPRCGQSRAEGGRMANEP